MPAILDPDKGTIYQGPKKKSGGGRKASPPSRSQPTGGAEQAILSQLLNATAYAPPGAAPQMGARAPGYLDRHLDGYQLMAARFARKKGIPVPLFLAQMDKEASFDPTAVSPAGALGIAQFMPATAEGMGVNPLDPRDALRGAAELDRRNFAKYKNWYDVLSLYNSGKGWAQGQNISETNNYVNTIMSNASKPWGGINAGGSGGGFGRLFPIFGKTPITWGGGPESHGARPLGNWQSDNAYDLMSPAGTPVYAVARGRINPNAGFGPQNSSNSKVYGSRLNLDVPGPNQLFYTHLSRIAPGIVPGRKVKPGSLLGWTADYGNADHVHFASLFGDPRSWLEGSRAPFGQGPAFTPEQDYGSGLVSTAYGPAPASVVGGVSNRIAPLVGGVEAAADAAYAPAYGPSSVLSSATGPVGAGVKSKGRKRKGGNLAIDQLIANLLNINGSGALPGTTPGVT